MNLCYWYVRIASIYIKKVYVYLNTLCKHYTFNILSNIEHKVFK